MRVWQANAHRWGDGKAHLFDSDNEGRTVCGRRVADIPGREIEGSAATCRPCQEILSKRESWDERERACAADAAVGLAQWKAAHPPSVGLSVPTRYRGIVMRSALEARVAAMLDRHDVRWEYEPRSFQLGGLRYVPDFWLPEITTWLEAKGAWRSQDDALKVRALAAARCRERWSKDESAWWRPAEAVVVVADDSTLGMWVAPGGEIERVGSAVLVRCRGCGKTWWLSHGHDWSCRACGKHEGSHHWSPVLSGVAYG